MKDISFSEFEQASSKVFEDARSTYPGLAISKDNNNVVIMNLDLYAGIIDDFIDPEQRIEELTAKLKLYEDQSSR